MLTIKRGLLMIWACTLDNQSGFGRGFSPQISIGLTPFSKKLGKLNYKRDFKIAIGANFGGRRSFFFSQQESFPYDTLSSSVGNPDIIVDSVHFSNQSYIETVYELKIGLSYLFKTDASKRWYLYVGIGSNTVMQFRIILPLRKMKALIFQETILCRIKEAAIFQAVRMITCITSQRQKWHETLILPGHIYQLVLTLEYPIIMTFSSIWICTHSLIRAWRFNLLREWILTLILILALLWLALNTL